MSTDQSSANSRNASLVRKISWTALSGFIAFSGSALLDDMHVSLADQLVLTFIASGTTLMIQYLSEFEQRLRESENYQRQALDELQASLRAGFSGVSEATALMEDLKRSAVPRDSLKQAIRRAGLITSTTRPLLRGIAASEVERLSENLQSMADGHEVFYEGEDRELLLALTRRATKSILATSWATVSAHGVGFEAGFWLNDLGGRYLELQRMALRRGVTIRRVFIYEAADVINSEELKRILSMQQNAGIEVKLLGGGPIPPDGSIADFVLFDEQLSYDTTPVTRGETSVAPWLLTTRLVLEDDLVQHRIDRFQELWGAAEDPQRVLRARP